MNRRLSILVSLISVWLVIALASACKPESRSQVSQPTVAPSAQPLPTATATSAAPTTATPMTNKPPVCQFNTIVPDNPVSPVSINDYSVSPLTPVLSDTVRMNIYGWLPDNERLIISRRNPDKANHTLATLSVTTGLIQTYAERNDADGDRPIWLPDLQALAYTDFDLPQKPSSLPGIELWLSWGNPNETQLLAEHVSMNSLTVDDTGQLAYLFSQKNVEPVDLSIKTVDAAVKSIRNIPLPAALSKSSASADESLSEVEKPWKFLHRPTTSQTLLLYKNQAPLLFDFTSGQICQIDLPSYVNEALWSPDGRFLAMRTQDAAPSFIVPSVLTILDTNTDQHYKVDLGTHVHSMAWSPNSRYLAVLAQNPDMPESVVHQSLYLVDVVSQEHRLIFPDYDFHAGGNQNYQMAWSFNGKMLAITCPVVPLGSPVVTEFRLCLIQLTQAE